MAKKKLFKKYWSFIIIVITLVSVIGYFTYYSEYQKEQNELVCHFNTLTVGHPMITYNFIKKGECEKINNVKMPGAISCHIVDDNYCFGKMNDEVCCKRIYVNKTTFTFEFYGQHPTYGKYNSCENHYDDPNLEITIVDDSFCI